MTPELEALQVRVGNGIAWLVEHDPDSRFHLWFAAAISPIGPMPAQGDEVRKAYSEYYGARITYERLERQLAVLEERDAYHLPGLGDAWRPTDPAKRQEVRQR